MTHDHNSRMPKINGAVRLVVGLLLLATPAAGQFDRARADFLADVFNHQDTFGALVGVFADGAHTFSCLPGIPSVPFDYVDSQDTGCLSGSTTPADDNAESFISGGGAWRLRLNSGGPRRLTLHFGSGFPVDPTRDHCAYLASLPGGCACDSSCQVPIWIAADRLFKKKATRQSLDRFDVFLPPAGGPDWRVNWIEPLFLCPDPFGSDWRVLQSADCDNDGIDVSLAEVVDTATNEVVGEWHLPIQIRVQRTPFPDDGGGAGPGCDPGQTDADGDGVCTPDDCDDSNPDIFPGNNDTKGKLGHNGVDNDCNGIIDG